MDNRRLLKQIFTATDLRKKVLVVLGLIVIYRILSFIPIPTPDPEALRLYMQQLFGGQGGNNLLDFVNLFSGGAIANFSIVLMSLGPYINASIIMQLLQQIMPNLKELKKEGESGRQKINQYTRILTIPLSMIQAVAVILLVRQGGSGTGIPDVISNPAPFDWLVMITALVAGSTLLMWIGELITEQGIGNGISLLITGGIIAQLPSISRGLFELATTNSGQIVTIALFVAATVVVTYFLVKLTEATRNITISYAKRIKGNRQYGGVESTLPVKLIIAGVIPIIFAVALLALPGFLGQIFANSQSAWLAGFADQLQIWFDPQNNIYALTYFGLVIVFTYFYTGIVFDTDDIAENLQKNGGFVPGIRPGQKTATYLKKVVNRLNLFGSISLGLVAVLPFIFQRFTNSSLLTIGGTGLLIVVSVAIETLRQLEAQALTASYE